MDNFTQNQWILEFLVQQRQIPIQLITRLISALSPSIYQPRLCKRILIRRIWSQIEKGVVSEMILDTLEMIEEIDKGEGVRALESMKKGYRAVAVDCVVRFLRKGEYAEYGDAIDRIWGGGVGRGGLGWEKWKDLKCRLEEAVHNASVCKGFKRKDTRSDAVKAVGVFLEDVEGDMGGLVLELVAGMVDKGLGGELGRNDGNVLGNNFGNVDVDDLVLVQECRQVNEKGEEVCQEAGPSSGELAPEIVNENVENKALEVEKEISLSELAAAERVDLEGGNDVRNNGNVEENNTSEMDVDDVRRQVNEKGKEVCEETWPPIVDLAAEIVNENVKNRVRQGRSLDALDENLEGNRGCCSREGFKQMEADCSVMNFNVTKERGVNDADLAEKQDGVSMNRCDDSGGNRYEDALANGENTRNPTGTKRSSLMERNNTAHTYEWHDDSIESISEGSQSCPHQGTARSRLVTLVGRQQIKNVSGRRKMKRWSSLEEDTLVAAVKEHGRGNWKRILDENRNIFEDRTAVDLKDKWRNMTK